MWPRAMTEPGVRAAPGPASVLFPSVHLFPGSEIGRLRPGPRRPVETLQTAPSPIQRRGGKRSLGPAHQAHTAEHGALAGPRREPPHRRPATAAAWPTRTPLRTHGAGREDDARPVVKETQRAALIGAELRSGPSSPPTDFWAAGTLFPDGPLRFPRQRRPGSSSFGPFGAPAPSRGRVGGARARARAKTRMCALWEM